MYRPQMLLDGSQVGGDRCYVIAEIGHNHQGRLDVAKELVSAAYVAGADAVKLQKRDNATLYTRAFAEQPYAHENSFGRTYGEHREALELDRDEYLELKSHAAELGITLFATAFDHASADFLADLDMPAYKLASGDLRNLPLIRHVGSLGKPVLFSTGGGVFEDVYRAYETLKAVNEDVVVLQCTAGYPSEWAELDLRVISTYCSAFPDAVVGFSGHDSGIAMSVIAYTLGARVIEKHFTLNRTMRGTDHVFSLEPEGMRKLVRDLRRAEVALGSEVKRCHPSELQPIRKMSKQIVAAAPLPAGHVLRAEDLAFRSPGGGLPPSEADQLLGRTLVKALAADDPLSLDLVAGAPPQVAEPQPSAVAHGA
jgi:N-acetylneuraminate synthase/sialic acid synthase